jgi:hypothetical protein
MKLATTVVDLETSTTQTPFPEQGPLQPAKSEEESGEAVKVTGRGGLEIGTAIRQFFAVEEQAESGSPGIAAETVPDPPLTFATVRVQEVPLVNTATTVLSAP